MAIVHDVQLFFDSTSHSSSSTSTSSQFLFNSKNLESFYHFIKMRKYQPTTISEKLRRVRMAIQFVLHETEESHHDLNLFVKGTHLVNLLSQWTKSLSKSIAIQRQKHGIKMSKDVAIISDPYDFLESREVKTRLEKAKDSLKEEEIDISDVKLLTAYAAAKIVYTNSQRSGVIKNLTIEEFEARNIVNNQGIIYCTNHKTGPQGRARLVVDSEDFEFLLAYKTLVRDRISPFPGCEHLLFLTHNGSVYNQVYRKILEAIRASNLQVTNPPPPSAHRVVISTEVARRVQCDLKRRKINKHLSHSDQTSERYYEFTNDDDAAEAYEELQKLIKDIRKKKNKS